MGISCEEYERQKSRRFCILTESDTFAAGLIPEPSGWSDVSGYVVENIDGKPARVVGSDGGSPEDQVLLRDFAWVADALNEVAESRGAQSSPDGLHETLQANIKAAAAAVLMACGVEDDVEAEAEQLRIAALRCRDLGNALRKAVEAQSGSAEFVAFNDDMSALYISPGLKREVPFTVIDELRRRESKALTSQDRAAWAQEPQGARQTGVCPNCGYAPVIALPAPLEQSEREAFALRAEVAELKEELAGAASAISEIFEALCKLKNLLNSLVSDRLSF